MDKIDSQIVAELMVDARKPFRRIAKKIGISTQTVIKRYNELKAKGAIQVCAISINLKKIGYQGTAYLLMRSLPETNLSESIEQLKKTENIIIATKAIGDFEGYAVLIFKDIKDLYQRVLQIKRLPNIDEIDVSFTLPGIECVPPPANRNYWHQQKSV